MKVIFKTLLTFLVICQAAFAQTPAATLPDFGFFRLDNSKFMNNNLEQGKKIFIVFFDSECDHCQHAIEHINKNYDEFKKAAVYLITQDDLPRLTRFMNKYGNNLKDRKNVTILLDRQKEFIWKFKPRKYPSIFLYSPQKKLIMYDDNEQNLFRFANQIKTGE